MSLDKVKSIFNRKGLLFICKSIKDWFIGLFTFEKFTNGKNHIINTIKFFWKIIVNLFLLAVAIIVVLSIIVLMLCYMVISFIAKIFKIIGMISLWIGNIIDVGLSKIITMIDNVTSKIKKFVEREETLNESNSTNDYIADVSDAKEEERS